MVSAIVLSVHSESPQLGGEGGDLQVFFLMFRPMLWSYLNFQRSGGFGLFLFILNHQFPILWEKKHGIDELPIMVISILF